MVDTEEELETLLRELEVRIEDLNDYVDDDPTPIISDTQLLDDFLDRFELRVGEVRENWTDEAEANAEKEAKAEEDAQAADSSE